MDLLRLWRGFNFHVEFPPQTTLLVIRHYNYTVYAASDGGSNAFDSATSWAVARRAGVTTATVSNVINNKGIVGEETRQRVLAIIEELSYRPNLVARGLRQKLSYTIALILPSISNPFYPEIADEIEAVAREQHYHILLCNTHFDPAIGREQLESLSTRWIDGLLVAAGSISASEVLMMLQRNLPMVLCLDWQEEESIQTLPLVTVDFFRAGELAAVRDSTAPPRT